MAQIEWNVSGEKNYEYGIDNAVLYVEGRVPVSWNGLMSVSHQKIGGESSPVYSDGIKSFDNIAKQEYKSVIRAITTPDEFNLCNGVRPVDAMGLIVTDQARKNFNLCYRTLVGNDLDGTNKGYKIHLLYNAKVISGNTEYRSMSNTAIPLINTWTITAIPPLTSGYLNTPYRVVDSQKYSLAIMAELEDILYGNATTDPRFPTPSELTTILGG